MLRTDTFPTDRRAHIDDHRALHKRYNADHDVMEYGAKGDGVTDDATAIQNAIDAAQNAGGGRVFFAPGAYRIRASLYVATSGIHLCGVGRASRLVSDGAAPTMKVQGTGLGGGMVENVEIDHLWIEGGATGATGIEWAYALHPRIFMCGFRGCGGYGIQLGPEVYNTAITHSVVQSCKSGGIKFGTNVHQVSVMCSRIQGNWGPGIDSRTGRSYALCVTGNVIEGNRGPAYICDETSGVQAITFLGNYFEKNNFYAVGDEQAGPQIDLGTNGRGYVIMGNYFWGSIDDSTHAILVRAGRCGVVAGNSMLRHTDRDVEIRAGADQWFVMQIPDLSTAEPPSIEDTEGIYYDTRARAWCFGGAVRGQHQAANGIPGMTGDVALDGATLHFRNGICVGQTPA